MNFFYYCLNIAGVFGGVFKKKFKKRLDDYDFKKWKGEDDIFGIIEN